MTTLRSRNGSAPSTAASSPSSLSVPACPTDPRPAAYLSLRAATGVCPPTPRGVSGKRKPHHYRKKDLQGWKIFCNFENYGRRFSKDARHAPQRRNNTLSYGHNLGDRMLRKRQRRRQQDIPDQASGRLQIDARISRRRRTASPNCRRYCR